MASQIAHTAAQMMNAVAKHRMGTGKAIQLSQSQGYSKNFL
jgi:hypothetical protein